MCEEVSSPSGRLEMLLRLHINIAYNFPESVTVFNKEWRHLPDPALQAFINQRKQYEHAFKLILEQGRQAGEFEFADTEMIFRILLQTVKFSYFSVRKFSRDELIKEVLHFVTKGILSRSNIQ
jgi:hypothetical protein